LWQNQIRDLCNSRTAAVAFVVFATFTDIVAYSVAVPVLPDLSRKLGASPTIIGFLFSSFGITLLTVSMPMGSVSDRIGRRAPLVGGLVALAASTALFAFGGTLPILFAARLVQGAADAVTWVVGFALLADLFGPSERGRVTGIIMSGVSVAFMVGPVLGGWLYEIGGMRLPFLTVALLAMCGALACLWLRFPTARADREHVPVMTLVRVPAVAACTAAVVAASATISMLEPVLALQLETTLDLRPARVGMVFGVAAVPTALLHPLFGKMADRFGARRLTSAGLVLTAGALILLGQTWSFQSALLFYAIQAGALALVITPSLAYMAEATSEAGIGSFGVAYGLYNMAWGAGLLGGPALGGFLFERIGFLMMAFAWTPWLVVVAWTLARVQSRRTPDVPSASQAAVR
jgi:DHA1 family solute carrier family 18 vesicular amine transporter 1/2